MEAEDLRYHKELLQWKLAEATGRYDAAVSAAPSIKWHQTKQMPAAKTSVVSQANAAADAALLDRYIVSKHTAVYPNEKDVSNIDFIASLVLYYIHKFTNYNIVANCRLFKMWQLDFPDRFCFCWQICQVISIVINN